MKTARSITFLTTLCIALLGFICGLVLLPKSSASTALAALAANTPTMDATGTSAAGFIATVLASTYTPTATPTPVATPTPSITPTRLSPTPDKAATHTRAAEKMATAVAATLTAQPTTTPNLAATKTQEAIVIKTSVAATLTARPTATPSPTPPPTMTPTHPPPPPPVIPTATRAPATVNLEMIVIPAGDFVMGSSASDSEVTLQECNQTEGNCQLTWFDGEQPARTLYLPEFRISKYEVTNSQYKVCVTNGVCPPVGRIAAATDIPYEANFFADALPVVAVSWDNANTFCRWLGARLPTEEEWEKAARGVDGTRRYPWGYAFEPGRANLASGFPTAVGSYPNGASPYGVQDLAGNVFEWTATATGDGRYILRGGAWSKFYFRGRVADRGTKLAPDFVNYDIGFRCVR